MLEQSSRTETTALPHVTQSGFRDGGIVLLISISLFRFSPCMSVYFPMKDSLQHRRQPERSLQASVTINPATVALVVAMAWTIFPAMPTTPAD